MDHCNQTWVFRVMLYCLSHWFWNALNLYMSTLWLNARVVRRRYSEPAAPIPFHVTDQTCHLVNSILCCRKCFMLSVNMKWFIQWFLFFKMSIMADQSTLGPEPQNWATDLKAERCLLPFANCKPMLFELGKENCWQDRNMHTHNSPLVLWHSWIHRELGVVY